MHHHSATLNIIDALAPQMRANTVAWAEINSGSYHLAGLDRFLAALQAAFAPLGGMQEVITLDPFIRMNRDGVAEAVPLGKALRIRKRPDAPIKILLVGHMDTVFGADHPFQQVRALENGILNGPGVADLKGGLAVMQAALTAFEQSEHAANVGWEILLNPDEEIGSPGSDPLLRESAARNDIGLVYEPALADGTLAGDRKGSGNFTIIARGRAAHAGRAFGEGRNAIAALAQYIRLLYELNGKQPGVTINPGIIEGGRALNIVPDVALCRFNVRVASQAEQMWVESQLEAIAHSLMHLDGIRFELHGGFSRPPKILSPDNLALFELVRECGVELGQNIAWRATGGCCDGNNLAAYGLPNVDTMGVRGGELHSDREFMFVDSLVERAKLSALLLLKIASGEFSLVAKGRVN